MRNNGVRRQGYRVRKRFWNQKFSWPDSCDDRRGYEATQVYCLVSQTATLREPLLLYLLEPLFSDPTFFPNLPWLPLSSPTPSHKKNDVVELLYPKKGPV